MKKRFWVLFGLSMFSVLLFSQPSFSKEKLTQPVNIVIITIDTLRADHLGCYGYRSIKTPQIDTLAKEGVLFEKAFTPVPTTLPAHTSIFTGAYPISHGLKHNGTFALTDSATTLAEQIKAKGYHTAAFISSFVLDSRFGLDQGFEFYDDDLVTGVNDPTMLQKERRAETLTKAAIKWLGSNSKNKPFFLWVHYYDPHDKYNPPSPFAEAYAHAPYDGEIAYTDSWVGVLINKLKEMGTYDHTLLILASDHGESLGEHHEDTHGIFLYDATLHVPLIFRYPGQLPRNLKINSLVRLIDIAPTVLDLLGQKIPATMQGVSLLPLMNGKKKDLQLTLYCETEYPKFTYGWSPLEGMRTHEWKYIKAPEIELYNLLQDPVEQKNISQKEKEQLQRHQKELVKLRQQLTPSASSTSRSVSPDQETRDKLKSLGYVLATDTQKNQSTYPDPKNMINLLTHFNKGAEYLGQKKYEEAIAEFKKVLKKDPKNTDVFTCLGAVYQAMDKTEQALEAYQQAVSLGHDHVDNLLQLGNLYMKINQPEKGKEIFERILSLNDKCKEAHLNLGIYYVGQEKWPESRISFEKVLALEPKDMTANNHLVSVYYKQGETDKAIKLCQSILAENPKDPSALYNLGSIRMEQKQYPEALETFRKLTEAQPDYSKGYQYMGMVYFYQQSFDQAITAFRQAAAKEPKWIDPHLNLGILYAQYKADFENALQEFQKVLEIDPSHALARQFLEQTKRTIEQSKTKGDTR